MTERRHPRQIRPNIEKSIEDAAIESITRKGFTDDELTETPRLADIEPTTLETERLVLRPWRECDAQALFNYACDPDVADPAGWPPHQSIDFSLSVIRTVFSAPYTFAVVLKESDEPIGCCGIVPPEARENAKTGGADAEIGYWLGKPYWGKGIIPEAVDALVRFCFSKLDMMRVWISCYEFNHKSCRVAEKCGFVRHHTECPASVTEIYWLKEKPATTSEPYRKETRPASST